MSGILVQTREASPLLHDPRSQGAPRAVPDLVDPTRRRYKRLLIPVGLSDGVGDPSRRLDAQARLPIGSLLYLGSVGLIAAGIIAFFFGGGFLLLVRTADGTVSTSADRADQEIVSLGPALGNDKQQTFFGQAPAPENKDAAQRSAALPARTDALAMDRKDNVPRLDGIPISKALTDTSAVPVNAPVLAPNSPAETAPAPPTLGLSKTEIAELLEHGDALLLNGDVASARLFYERAAGAGDGRAALRLGATFDAEFLGRLGLGKLQANPAEARSWYSRARDLGAVEAKRRLNSVETSTGNSLQ